MYFQVLEYILCLCRWSAPVKCSWEKFADTRQNQTVKHHCYCRISGNRKRKKQMFPIFIFQLYFYVYHSCSSLCQWQYNTVIARNRCQLVSIMWSHLKIKAVLESLNVLSTLCSTHLIIAWLLWVFATVVDEVRMIVSQKPLFLSHSPHFSISSALDLCSIPLHQPQYLSHRSTHTLSATQSWPSLFLTCQQPSPNTCNTDCCRTWDCVAVRDFCPNLVSRTYRKMNELVSANEHLREKNAKWEWNN